MKQSSVRKLFSTKSLCVSAVIAALYAALTLLLAPISYGNLQCRVSEALTLLPAVLPQAIPGLFVGCLIANLFSPAVNVFDIVFGSLATLLAAYGTYKLRAKPILAYACPIISNGIIVGLELALTLGLPIALTMAEVALGEIGAVLIGVVMLYALKKVNFDFSRFDK